MEHEADALVYRAWRQRINAPQTGSVGRLFDAAAALVLGVREASYEGQGPMMLEAVAAGAAGAGPDIGRQRPLPLRADGAGLPRLDWEPLLPVLLDTARPPAGRAGAFHAALAASVVAVAQHERQASGVDRVALTGDVFQNAYLTELAGEALAAQGLRVFSSERLPCNGGGLSYGQIVELAGRRRIRGVSC